MQTSSDREMIVPGVKIAPAYQKAMVASEFLTQDLEEVSGGVQ